MKNRKHIKTFEDKTSELNISDVSHQRELLEDFVKHIQNNYGELLNHYTETIVEAYLSSNSD